MSKSYAAELGLVFVAFIWGTTFVVVKNVVGFIPPFVFNSLRFFLAGFGIVVWIIVFRPSLLSGLNRAAFWKGIQLGIWLFLGYGFLTLGLVYTSATNAGFITGLNVVFVPVFSIVLMSQKMDRFTFSGVVAAALGLYLLTVKDSLSLNRGDLLTLAGAVAFAFHVIFTGKFTRHHPAILLVLIQIMVVGILSFACAAIWEDTGILLDRDRMFSYDLIIAMLIVVLLATGAALVIQTRVQRSISPSKVALIYSLEPVFAAVSGYFWAGEILGIASIAGCIMIFSGMIIVDLPKSVKGWVSIDGIRQ